MFARLCSARFGSKRKKYKASAKPCIQDDTEYGPRHTSRDTSTDTKRIHAANGDNLHNVSTEDCGSIFGQTLRPASERASLRKQRRTTSGGEPTDVKDSVNGMKDYNENDHAKVNTNLLTTGSDYDKMNATNAMNQAIIESTRKDNPNQRHSRLISEPATSPRTSHYQGADYYDLNSDYNRSNQQSEFSRRSHLYNSEHSYRGRQPKASMANVRYQSQNFSKKGHRVYTKDYIRTPPTAVSVAREVFTDEFPLQNNYVNVQGNNKTFYTTTIENSTQYQNMSPKTNYNRFSDTFIVNKDRKLSNTVKVLPNNAQQDIKSPSTENSYRPKPKPRTSIKRHEVARNSLKSQTSLYVNQVENNTLHYNKSSDTKPQYTKSYDNEQPTRYTHYENIMRQLQECTSSKPLNMKMTVKQRHLPARDVTADDEVAIAPGMLINVLYKHADWVFIKLNPTHKGGFVPMRCIDWCPIGQESSNKQNGHMYDTLPLPRKQSTFNDVTNIRAVEKKALSHTRSLSDDSYRQCDNDKGNDIIKYSTMKSSKTGSAGKGRVTFKLPDDEKHVTLIPGVGIVKPPLEKKDSSTYRLGVYYDDTSDVTDTSRKEKCVESIKKKRESWRLNKERRSVSYSSTDSEPESGIVMQYNDAKVTNTISPSVCNTYLQSPKHNVKKTTTYNRKHHTKDHDNVDGIHKNTSLYTGRLSDITRRESFTSTASNEEFPKNYNGPCITVLFDYQAQHETDVSVEHRSIVRLLNDANKDWSYVLRADGREGFIPSSYAINLAALNTHFNLKTSYL